MPEHFPKIKPESQEAIIPLDRWLKESFEKEYDRQTQTLNRLGLLDILPESGEMGLVGLDGREYPLPKKEAIELEIRKNKEVYEKKIEQGFGELLITPFGMPLNRLIDALQQRILSHYKEGKLLAAKAKPSDPDEPLNLNQNQPLWVWDEWRGSDENGQCVYYPKSFGKNNHQGKTKQEILDTQREKSSPLAGWNISLIESNPVIPRQGKGKTIGGRKQLEANKSPEEYLELFRTDPQYAKEQGLTIEDWITLFIKHLEETNQVIDDFQGKGSISYLNGSFLSSPRLVARGYWYRGGAQASLVGSNPDDRFGGCGLRPAVGVGN